MHQVEAITGLLIVIVILGLVANRVRIAFPIVFVVGGAALAAIPGLPTPQLDPEVVFFVFLPPLLFAAAWLIPWQGFRQNLRTICLLAVLPVAATTWAVGTTLHWLAPEIGLATALVLGAIVSPPDAVSATAVTARLNVPKRMGLVLEGESLLNDATGLTLLYFTQRAVSYGPPAPGEIGLSFLFVAAVGVASGLLVGHLMCCALRRIQDNAVTMTLFFITPFCAYLLGEIVESSGVLATVTAGLLMARYSPDFLSSSVRLEVRSALRTQLFILNGLVFVLVGSQLPGILESVGERSLVLVMGHTAAIVGVVIGVRFLSVYAVMYLPALLVPRIRRKEGWPDWRLVLIISWTGMRGVVSMAAALSIPLTIAGGAAFPDRDGILFFTFMVILITLLVQGLSLPYLIHWLGLDRTGADSGLEVAELRLRLAKAGAGRVYELIEEAEVADSVRQQMRLFIDNRLNYLQEQYEVIAAGGQPTRETDMAKPWHAYHRMLIEGIQAEREELLRLNRSGEIDDELRRRFDYELDLEAVRLEGSRFA